METGVHLDDKHMNKIENVSFKPIFIIGLHRSGTSILYKILDETGQFNSVTAYHLLNYHQLLHNYINKLEDKVKENLDCLLKKNGLIERGIDHIKVTSEYVHEYIYIFHEKGYPRYLTKENKWLFENLCKKIQYISENDKPVLLKNPYEYRNFLFLNKIYPDAKFIFIHRDPIHTISSTMRTWRTILSCKNKYVTLFSKPNQYDHLFEKPILLFLKRLYYSSKSPLGIFETLRYTHKNVKYFLDNIEKLPKESYISVKYEDICKYPNEFIGKIIDFLGLVHHKDLSDLIKPRYFDLTPEATFLKRYIKKRMKYYYEYLDKI